MAVKMKQHKGAWWVFIDHKGKLLAKAGLRYIRMHDLRHTRATLLIQQEGSLAYVKEQVKHCSIQITMDIGYHLVPGGNKAAVDPLDGLETATICNLSATIGENAVAANTVGA